MRDRHVLAGEGAAGVKAKRLVRLGIYRLQEMLILCQMHEQHIKAADEGEERLECRQLMQKSGEKKSEAREVMELCVRSEVKPAGGISRQCDQFFSRS